jgi:hypothetical protein
LAEAVWFDVGGAVVVRPAAALAPGRRPWPSRRRRPACRRGRLAAGPVLVQRGDRLPDLHRVAGPDGRPQNAGRRGVQLDVRLVRLQLGDHVVLGDRVAVGLHPPQQHGLGDGFSQLGYGD